MVYSYNAIFSTFKRNELLILDTIWINLKTIMPNERARNKRPHVIFFYLYEIARKDKVIEIGSISVVALGLPVGAGIDQK